MYTTHKYVYCLCAYIIHGGYVALIIPIAATLPSNEENVKMDAKINFFFKT